MVYLDLNKITAALAIMLITLVAAPADGQLIERPLGYQFEEAGFLSMPGMMAYDAGRNRLAIADKGRRLIYIFDLTDKTFQTIGGDSDLPEPGGLAFDSRGSLYLAFDKTPFLLVYKIQSEIPDTLNLSAILERPPKSIARVFIDRDGFKYLVDNNDSQIYVLNSDNKLVRAIGDKLKRPDGVIMTSSGQLIIADKGYDPILIFNPNFEFERRFTRPESPTSQFSFNASGLALDQRGWIYTLDITRNQVVVYDPTGVSESFWTPANTPFFPVDIAIDRYDHIFISDTASGSVKTFARAN